MNASAHADGQLPDAERHVRAQHAATGEMRTREVQTALIAHAERQVRMRPERGLRPMQVRGPAEVDRLRELDDAVARKASHQMLTKVLVVWPEITEVAATVDEDRADRHAFAQIALGEVVQIARVADGNPGTIHQRALAEPDRAVADVGVVREVHQRARCTRYGYGVGDARLYHEFHAYGMPSLRSEPGSPRWGLLVRRPPWPDVRGAGAWTYNAARLCGQLATARQTTRRW